MNAPKGTQVINRTRFVQLAAIAVLAVVMIGSILVLSANAQPGGFYAGAGLAFRSSQAVSTAPVATVDGIIITQRDMAFARSLAGLNNVGSPIQVATDGKSVLEGLIGRAALDAEAARRGLRPSDSSVDAYMRDMRGRSTQFSTANSEIAAFANSAGLSVDQYFATGEARVGARTALAIQNLRKEVLRGVDPAGQAAAWDMFAAKVRASAQVVVSDPAFR